MIMISSIYLIIACDYFYLLAFFLIIICVKHQTTTKKNKNNDIVYMLQARAKTSPLERKTLKSLLFLIDYSIDEFHDLMAETNTLQDQYQPLRMMFQLRYSQTYTNLFQ